ncbi:MAG: site-specific integrase, partial [Bacteroidota bacterium]|nr:site-specific integrase [Bacteroidota bacterium]
MRIISNNQKAECRLPVEVCESELPNWNIILQRFENNKSTVNRFLNKYAQEFEDLKYSNSLNIDSFSAAEILNKITGQKKKTDFTVIEYFTKVYNTGILPDKEKSEGTKKNYNKAVNHFIKYFINLEKANILFSEIDRTLPERFKTYLISEIPKKKTRMSEVSASGYIKKIKTLFDSAISDGLIEINPFTGFKLKTKSPKKEKLTSMQIRAIYLEVWNSKIIEKAADIFMFSVFSGLAYSDAMNLKKIKLQQWSEGNVFIQIKREKTEVETRLFLVSFALQIIEKYKDDPQVQSNEYVLPRIDNSTYNKWLKIIAYKVGINFNVTTHTA